jgi:hypothetical protein
MLLNTLWLLVVAEVVLLQPVVASVAEVVLVDIDLLFLANLLVAVPLPRTQ